MEWSFEQGYYNACANRAYYEKPLRPFASLRAMFQAAVAALASVGVTPRTVVISHGWVQANFASELTRRRKKYPGMASYLNDARAIRDTADYESKMVNQRRASRTLRWAREMVGAIQKEVAKQ